MSEETIAVEEVVTPDVAPEVVPEVVTEAAPDAVVTPDETPADESTWEAVTEDVLVEAVPFGEYVGNLMIPADLANLAGVAGINITEVATELYNSEHFDLSDKTKEGLYKTFGKWQVDSYIAGVKAQNDQTVSGVKADVEAFTVASKEAWDNTMEVMEGEDRWDDMADFAARNLSEADVAEFNQVMETGSMNMQQIFIKDLYAKFDGAGKPVLSKEPLVLDLEDGDSGGNGEVTAMTRDQFLAVMQTDAYLKDPEKYDRLRRAGMQKGI